MEEIGGLGIPLRSLWPTLHCRRVAGVSPLLSIGWWYLSSGTPKRGTTCYRVSAADKGCRVYPLDPRPDAVALCSGCTPGKRRVFCQMTGTLPPLLDSVVGGGTPERSCIRVHMDPMLLCPGKGLVLPTLNIDTVSTHTRNDMSKISPFAIHKTLIGIGGEPKSVKRLRSGDMLIETTSALHKPSPFFLQNHFLITL
ncbi:uncharacterized protein TNCV_2310631 [Trichonephila clavipes]|nr:uncharacterized protein TNCV_2310631 [Trichonephila clavipes]